LWRLPGCTPEAALQLQNVDIQHVVFSPTDSKLLAFSDRSGHICLWNISSNKRIELPGHTDPVCNLSFSPDGRLLASGSFDKTVRLWDVARGACVRVLHEHMKYVYGVFFLPNGKQLLYCAYNNKVCKWTVCRWTDRTHMFFAPAFKATVFYLMCVRECLQPAWLPMEIWLIIFEFLEACY